MSYNKNLEIVLSNELDTHDKAYMFFKILFPEFIGRINLEGSPRQRAFFILDFFEKQQMLEQLEKELRKYFYVR